MQVHAWRFNSAWLPSLTWIQRVLPLLMQQHEVLNGQLDIATEMDDRVVEGKVQRVAS